jgi:glycosyltransferase involved in cell wall biosynthesis
MRETALRDRIIARGREVAGQLSWGACAREYAAVYEVVLQRVR